MGCSVLLHAVAQHPRCACGSHLRCAAAIVMGPNLFRPNMQVNPMEALMMSQKAVFFLQVTCQPRCTMLVVYCC